MTQMDLFEWAASRPTAQIIRWIPHLAKRMWEERGQAPGQHNAVIVGFPNCDHHPDVRKRA